MKASINENMAWHGSAINGESIKAAWRRKYNEMKKESEA